MNEITICKTALYFSFKRVLDTFYLAGLLDHKCEKAIQSQNQNIEMPHCNVLLLITAVGPNKCFVIHYFVRKVKFTLLSTTPHGRIVPLFLMSHCGIRVVKFPAIKFLIANFH